ncbi:Uncharacterised protein [Mycobacterium tuberculosis]|nr:Uncharacterised protein [Mycobacterium tuberculosis]
MVHLVAVLAPESMRSRTPARSVARVVCSETGSPHARNARYA